MPKHIFLQMDNCGENKNKYMTGYLTLLNQSGNFDTIQINFLIVGHTHGPIDQYFSVLTNKLWDTYFVGSPMALQCLFMECESPSVSRQLHVHYDYKLWMEPYINKNQTYFATTCIFNFKGIRIISFATQAIFDMLFNVATQA